MSIQDIRQDPQVTSNFYLANIYQILADPNRSNISSSLPASPPPFSPPTYAVWVNALWFLSLVISLTCALLATLLQQWARRYLKATQSRYTPDRRARIRAFLAEGVDKLLLPWTVEALPTLLHISLFLFFAGLVVFLWNVNLTILKLVLSWVGICTALYGCITVMPIFRHDSPYLTPLSLPAWHIATRISCLIFQALRRFLPLHPYTRDRFYLLVLTYRRWFVQGMQKTVEESALYSPSEIVTRAFMWTFDSLDEDHELESFFSGLPGFRSSKLVNDPLPNLTEEQRWRLSTAIYGLLDRSFSSDLVPASVKKRRAMSCAKATDPAHIPRAFDVFDRILSHYQESDPPTAEILQIVRGWGDDKDENTILVSQATVSSFVARAKRRDDAWFILASNELSIPESILRGHAAHGDSLSLAILIHVTRHQFSHFRKSSWSNDRFSKVLKDASIFDVQDTLPELQHEFCALWNQIVRKVQNDLDVPMAFYTLRPIRNVYLALHQGTDSATTQFSASTGDGDRILERLSTYPMCNVPGHHPDSTPHIHDDPVSTTFMPTVLYANAEPLSTSLSGTPHAPSPSVPALLHVDENLVDVPLINKSMSVSTSFYPAHQTAMGNPPSPGTSQAQVVAGTTQDIETFPRTNHLFTQEPSTLTPPPEPMTLTPPPDTVAVEHIGDSHASLDDLDVPSSPSPTPTLDGMLSAGRTCVQVLP